MAISSSAVAHHMQSNRLWLARLKLGHIEHAFELFLPCVRAIVYQQSGAITPLIPAVCTGMPSIPSGLVRLAAPRAPCPLGSPRITLIV